MKHRGKITFTLILLFTPFREESSLLLENETGEEAFHRLNEDSLAHHAKLNKTLEAQSKIKKIKDARQTGEEQKWLAKRMNG